MTFKYQFKKDTHRLKLFNEVKEIVEEKVDVMEEHVLKAHAEQPRVYRPRSWPWMSPVLLNRKEIPFKFTLSLFVDERRKEEKDNPKVLLHSPRTSFNLRVVKTIPIRRLEVTSSCLDEVQCQWPPRANHFPHFSCSQKIWTKILIVLGNVYNKSTVLPDEKSKIVIFVEKKPHKE